ncbi:Protein CD4.1 [Aphelenchoides avenae]|nr:Protein CD4.1 [Aphelenchus avenae]
MRSRDFADGPGEMDMLIGFFLMNGACIVFFLMFGMCVICSCMRRKPNFNSSEKPEKEAKRPKKEKEHSPAPPKPTFAAPPPITSPSLKPTFKAIVARAMENQRLMKQQVTAGTKSEATVESGEACAPMLTANDTGKNNRRSATSDAAHGDDAQRTTLLRPKEDGDAVKECRIDIEAIERRALLNRSNTEPRKKVRNHAGHHKLTVCTPNNVHADGKPTLAQEEEDDNASADAASVDEEAPSVVRQNLLGPLSFDDLYYT